MKYLLLGLFLVLFSANSFADRRQDLLQVIDEELSEVSRLNRQIQSRNPNLILRMAELYLEKARIYKDIENQKFLTIPYGKRIKVNKNNYFKKSRAYFIKAQKACYFILKRFKRFKGRGDVYYVLAFNAKEFQQDDRAFKYFKKSIKYTKRGSTTNRKARLAVAEILYNRKEYKKAIPYYESSLNAKKSKWWTKDAFNMAWCYFRNNNKKKAISVMNQIYQLSKNPKFYDMTAQVERDLAFFYTDAGKVNNAVSFYKKRGKQIVPNLIKVSKILLDQGKYSSAQKVLVQARGYKTNDRETVEIAHSLLILYEKFGKVGKHLTISKEMVGFYKKGILNEVQFENLKYQIKKMAALLQKQVAGKTYKRQKKVRAAKGAAAVEYFKLEAIVDPGVQHMSYFHIGETYFAIGKYNDAIEAYSKANELSRNKNDKKIRSLSLNGMMVALGKPGVSKKYKDMYLEQVYKKLIASKPRDKKTFKTYQRLFSLQYEKGKIPDAVETLYGFKNSFPKSLSTQEAMLARVMDHYKKKGDVVQLKSWVKKINNGEFKVSKKLAKTLNAYLLTVQFEGAEKANTKGEKVYALKSYVAIYRDPKTSKAAKTNAAYNIAVLFHELGNAEKAYGWLKQSLKLMSLGQVLKFEKSFLTMTTQLFNRQRLAYSAELFEELLRITCNSRSKNKNLFFKNAGFTYISSGSPNSAENLIVKYGKKCRIPNRIEDEIRRDVIDYLVDRRAFEDIEKVIPRYEKRKSLHPYLIVPSALLRKAYISRGNAGKANSYETKMKFFYSNSKRNRLDIPLESLDQIALVRIEGLNRYIRNFNNIPVRFPEKVFNDALNKKFAALEKLASAAFAIFDVGSGLGIVKSYRIVVENYEKLHKEITSFTPPGKSAEYISSFKKGMAQYGSALMAKSNEFRSDARKQIRKNKILSKDNYFFLSNAKFPVDLEYMYRKQGVLMDRSGGK